MKQYIKPSILIEEAALVSMIQDSVNFDVVDEDADFDDDILGHHRDQYGDLW